jgi:hypothetical protein
MMLNPVASYILPFLPMTRDFSILASNFALITLAVPNAWMVLILPITSSANVPALETYSSEPTTNLVIAVNMMKPQTMMTGRMAERARARRQDRA